MKKCKRKMHNFILKAITAIASVLSLVSPALWALESARLIYPLVFILSILWIEVFLYANRGVRDDG